MSHDTSIRPMMNLLMPLSLAALLVLSGCNSGTGPGTAGDPRPSKAIHDARIANHGLDEWLSYGRDYTEQRFVASAQINKDNIADLGLAYSVDLGTKLGNVATPLLVDGERNGIGVLEQAVFGPYAPSTRTALTPIVQT